MYLLIEIIIQNRIKWTYNESVRCTNTVEPVIERLELPIDGTIEDKICVQLYVLWKTYKHSIVNINRTQQQSNLVYIQN